MPAGYCCEKYMDSKIHLIHQQINKSFPSSQGRALRGLLMADHLIVREDQTLVATPQDLLSMPVNGGVWYDLQAWIVFGTKAEGGYDNENLWSVLGSFNGTAEAEVCVGTVTVFNKQWSE